MYQTLKARVERLFMIIKPCFIVALSLPSPLFKFPYERKPRVEFIYARKDWEHEERLYMTEIVCPTFSNTVGEFGKLFSSV